MERLLWYKVEFILLLEYWLGSLSSVVDCWRAYLVLLLSAAIEGGFGILIYFT